MNLQSWGSHFKGNVSEQLKDIRGVSGPASRSKYPSLPTLYILEGDPSLRLPFLGQNSVPPCLADVTIFVQRAATGLCNFA